MPFLVNGRALVPQHIRTDDGSTPETTATCKGSSKTQYRQGTRYRGIRGNEKILNFNVIKHQKWGQGCCRTIWSLAKSRELQVEGISRSRKLFDHFKPPRESPIRIDHLVGLISGSVKIVFPPLLCGKILIRKLRSRPNKAELIFLTRDETRNCLGKRRTPIITVNSHPIGTIWPWAPKTQDATKSAAETKTRPRRICIVAEKTLPT